MAAILLLMNGVTNILLALLNKQNKCLIINQKNYRDQNEKSYIYVTSTEVDGIFVVVFFVYFFLNTILLNWITIFIHHRQVNAADN